jgi:hypothetical protein
MAVVFSNNATTVLSSNITNSATSIAVADGSVFPALSGVDYFYATLQDPSNTKREIVKVTARSGNTLTVTRAVDGSSASAFSTSDIFELRLNAAALNDAVNSGTADLELNLFTGDGSAVAFTLSTQALEANTLAYIDGVYQNKSAYSISGYVLTFSAAPDNGAAIEVTAATVAPIQESTDFLLNQFTGDGSDVTFTLSSSPLENQTTVYVSGVYQSKSSYSVSGTTLTFSTAPPNSAAIEVMVARTVVYAVGTPANNTVTTAKIVDDAVTSAKLSNALSTKIDGIEASADVTTASKIQTAGGLLDSELTSIVAVKALNQGVATGDSPDFAALNVNGTATVDGLVVDGNAGIGGSTITDVNLLNIQGSGASKNIGVVFNDTNTSKIFAIQNGGSVLKFFDYTASAERMRIDSSGVLMLGRTDKTLNADTGFAFYPNGAAYMERSNDATIIANRKGSSGGIIELSKDGTNIGAIGVVGGDEMYIASSGTSAGSGLRFQNEGHLIYPTDGTGAVSNGDLDLGNSSYRFKNLYLSSAVRWYSGSTQKAYVVYDGTNLMNYGGAGVGHEFYAGGNFAVKIDSSGNVGIGVSNPSDYYVNFNDLVLGNTSTHSGMTIASGNGADGTIAFADGTSGTAEYQGYVQYNHGYNSLTFGTAATNRMVIDSSGRVGISTTSPLAALTIGNNSADGTVDYTQGLVLSSTLSGGPWVHAGIVATGSTNFNGNLIFATDGNGSKSTDTSGLTERARIASNGNLYVGGQSVGASESFTAEAHGSLTVSRTSGSGRYMISFDNGNTNVGRITSNASATQYNTSSDYRLKEDDQPMTGATERVKALRPINFAWKVDGSRVDGFFAHEAQAVVPECATGTKDAMRDEEYEVTAAIEEVRDEDDNITTEAVEAVMGTRSVPDMQGIDQAKLVPLLTAALQEAITKIESLEARLSALEE